MVLVRKFIVHHLPENLFVINNYTFTSAMMIMVLFAILMLFSAYAMIKDRKEKIVKSDAELNYILLILEGLIIGSLTGLVGAGGGFLIIPALVLLVNLPMKNAVGTSLLIIAIKSLFGFIADIGSLQIDWLFISILSLISIAGIFLGVQLSKFIPNQKLKPLFGYFIIVMAVYIIIKELLF